MAGIGDLFGGMFGGPAPTPGLLDAAGYMDPAQYDAARRNQGMMGLWAGLLAGGGPSLEPRNFGSALGAGFSGMNQFGNQFDESQLHAAQAAQARANVGKLGAETETMRKGFEIFRKGIESGQFAGGAPGSGSTGGAPAAPGAGGDVPNFGAGSGGGGGWGPHAGTAIETLRAAGYSDAAIQGIMANGLGEGGFKSPWVKAGGGENSFGHWQFNARGELPGYLDFVRQQNGDPQDTRLQALYVAKRAEEVHPGFAKLDDPKLATDIFATKFERYQGAKPGQRYGLLTDAQRYMAGTPVETREALPAGPGGYAPEGATTGSVPAFAEGRAAALGGPVPAMLAAGAAPAPALLPRPGGDPNAPAAPVPAPLAGAPSGNRPGANLPASGAGLITPQDYQRWLATQQPPGGGNIRIEPLGSETVPAGDAAAAPAGQQFGVGGALSRTMGVPIPAAAVAPAPAVPPVAPAATQPPAVAAAPSPGATQPPAAPGPLTVTLPAPPAPLPPTALPAPPTPATGTLPQMPAIPAIPPRPEIPGAPGAAGGGGYNAQAHQAQMMALGLTMMGRTVPGFISDLAGIPAAGQKAAAEAAAKQPFELQNKTFDHLLGMAKSSWEKATEFEKERVAAANGLTKEQYKAQLDQIGEDRKAQQAQQGKQYDKQLEIMGAAPIEGQKTAAKAENEPVTRVLDGREVRMTGGQADRIARGEPVEQVLGPNWRNLTKEVPTAAEEARARAGATKSVDYSFKLLEEADTAGNAAGRNLQTLGQLAKAAEGFTTGAGREVWLDVKRYARDAGLITGTDVSDGELIRQGATKMAVMNAPRQGAMSNYERGLMSTINPQLVNTPEAFRDLVRIGARLDQYDQQVALIHNEVAAQNNGVPNYLEANRRIRALGPPISPEERAALDRLQSGGGKAAGGATAPAAPAAPSGAQYRWDPAANGGQGAVVPNAGR